MPNAPLSADALDTLFRNARSYSSWLEKPVGDDTLHELYELMKWGPTSVNCNPARFLFLRTLDAKKRLLPALSPANIEKVMTAPVTAIIGYDMRFFDKLPQLFPHNPNYKDKFAGAPELTEITAFRNG